MNKEAFFDLFKNSKFIKPECKDNITESASLFEDLMMDSFTTVLFIRELENTLNKEMDFTILSGVVTVGDLYERVKNL